jgi:DNA-binding NarL/FixJ family response regulator
MSERHGRPTVLLADDYEGICKAMTRLLRASCDVVANVGDGTALLETIERLRPEIVVLDLRMPGIDGLDACREIKAAKPDVDVIVCTAADEPWLRVRALEAGASAFVLKCRMGDDLVPAILRTRSVTPVADRQS